jgi:hypothetical protein
MKKVRKDAGLPSSGKGSTSPRGADQFAAPATPKAKTSKQGSGTATSAESSAGDNSSGEVKDDVDSPTAKDASTTSKKTAAKASVVVKKEPIEESDGVSGDPTAHIEAAQSPGPEAIATTRQSVEASAEIGAGAAEPTRATKRPISQVDGPCDSGDEEEAPLVKNTAMFAAKAAFAAFDAVCYEYQPCIASLTS